MDLRNIRIREGINDLILNMREFRRIIGSMTNNITQRMRKRLRWLRRRWSCRGSLVLDSLLSGIFPLIRCFHNGSRLLLRLLRNRRKLRGRNNRLDRGQSGVRFQLIRWSVCEGINVPD